MKFNFFDVMIKLYFEQAFITAVQIIMATERV